MTTAARAPLAYVGLGSNLEDPVLQLQAAFEALARIDGTTALRRSRLYRTPPWGRTDQPDFVNAVAEMRTGLAPEALLLELQRIERGAGRARRERWGPRVLDLDLLVHGDTRRETAALTLPHPHLHERAFVLLPLRDLAPELEIPGRGRVSDLLSAVDCDGIEALG